MSSGQISQFQEPMLDKITWITTLILDGKFLYLFKQLIFIIISIKDQIVDYSYRISLKKTKYFSR